MVISGKQKTKNKNNNNKKNPSRITSQDPGFQEQTGFVFLDVENGNELCSKW
jgi:hypothetical protein